MGINCWNRHTNTHIHTKFQENYQIQHISHILLVSPVCIGTQNTEISHESYRNSPPQRPDPSQVAAIEAAPGVHHKRRPLGMTEITQNNKYES